MFKTTSLCCFLLLSVLPALAQVEPSATGGLDLTLDDPRMMIPPPVSDQPFQMNIGMENRSNYFDAGMSFISAYNDNLGIGNGSSPISDETYTFLPYFSVARKTPRQSQLLSYSPGFTAYQHTSGLNAFNQNLLGQYFYHVSPYVTIYTQDSFGENSNTFNQTSSGEINGSPHSISPLLLVPFQKQYDNSASAGLNDQFGRNAMVGGSATYDILHYEMANGGNSYDGYTTGATGFYSRRFSGNQYAGLIYRYEKAITHPVRTATETQSTFGFYTVYLNQQLAISVMAGPQHYKTSDPNSVSETGWTPAVLGSISWQTPRSNISGSYAHLVRGADGLLGAQYTNSGNVLAQYRLAKTWSAGAAASFGYFSNVVSDSALLYPNGHTINETITVRHSFGENLAMQAGYARFDENGGLNSGANQFPGINRVYLGVSYDFQKPLGR